MDHPLDENVVEPDKYAFLLGCSLRENNLEQFFSIYDAILPKHLSESQLDKIKERARQISELPQDEFDVLVLSARDYSLAQGRPKMSGLDGTRGPGAEDWNSGSEDEEDATEGRCHLFSHGDNFTLRSKGSVFGEEDGCERDSGLPSSGIGAGSCDNEWSDSEERGVFDYFHSRSDNVKRSDAVKISETDNPDFDEAHDVESDKSSIESPRSDVSSTNEYNVTNPPEEEGTEMTTFSQARIPQFRGFNQLYNHPFVPYQPLKNECDSDCEVSNGTSYQQRKYTQGRSVDDSVCLSQMSKSYPYSLEEGLQKHESFCVRPPFGSQDPLKAVGNTINNLIGSGLGQVSNMPPGANIHEDARKKKNMKKKKGSKDDGDDRVSNSKSRKSYMNHDENGNPIDISAYRQMRETPNKTSEGSVRKNHNGPFSSESNFDSFHHKDWDDSTSSADRKKSRKKTQREQPVLLAEHIPNYVGDIDSVDYLVKFIETGEKQLKKKVSQKTSPSSEPPSKADKVIKRKEKKVKVGQADDASDSRGTTTDCGELLHSPTPSTSDVSSPPPLSVPVLHNVPPPELDTSEWQHEDMGNSVEKSAASNVVDSQTHQPEDRQNPKSVSPVVLNKDCDTHSERISSSKSPPLHKKEVEHRDKNKTKAKEKEKSLESTLASETKKQKGKNGKSDLQLKNNKKVENKNDIINSTKIEKMKIENGPIKLVSKLESDDLDITDNHQDYIFTDIDNLPPVEQEFTLVSKKKKRQGGKDVLSEIPRQKNGPRESFRGLPPQRSVTPPPPSSLHKTEQSRDLSPSSFPALGKKGAVSKGRPTFREGRRNSFGDVPIDTLTELRSQDDSDIESVKSLPAAKGGSLGDVVSSRFPVSYAKMAAAPKPPYSPSSPRADEEEGDMSDSQTDNASSRKPTVWKGSPTERRHSIGSSPEDTKQENSPKFTQRSRQKSGSQEFLLALDSTKSDVDVSVPDSVDKQSGSVSVNEVNNVSSSSSSENAVSEEPVAVPTATPGSKELTPEAQLSPSTDSQSIPTITVTLDSNKVTNVLKDNYQNCPKTVPSIGPPPNGPQRTKSPEVTNTTSAAARSQPVASSPSSSKDPRAKPVTAKVTNNSKKNNKSVIFLDKRFGDAPENLGITFGFDSNFDEEEEKGACDVEPVNFSVNVILQEKNSSGKKEPVNHNQIEPQSVPVTLPQDCSSKAELSVVPPAQVTAPVVSPALPAPPPVARGGGSVALPGSVPPPSTSSTKTSKTRVAGLNGVVVPKTQGYRGKTGSESLRTERVATSSEPKGATGAATAAASAANKDNNKTVLIFYGDGIVAKLGNSDVTIDSRDSNPPSSSQHKKIAFSQEANHKGKFNVNEAAKFLKQEWERVLEQQEKNPQAVQFYDGQ